MFQTYSSRLKSYVRNVSLDANIAQTHLDQAREGYVQIWSTVKTLSSCQTKEERDD